MDLGGIVNKAKQAIEKNPDLIEKGGDFGGTWYWNRYPGAACDTESYIYLPLLEETGYNDIPILDIDHVNTGAYIRNTLAADKNENRQDAQNHCLLREQIEASHASSQ